MSFSFGSNTTNAGSTFGTTTPSTGFSIGGGDAVKPLFGTTNTENKPAFNFSNTTAGSTPAFGTFSFGGAKTTAGLTSLFSPSTTTAIVTPGFGANKPLNFGAPPNQTVGSPGFGQPATQQGQTSVFSHTLTQSTPTPAFGSPTTQASAFGTPRPVDFGFGKPAVTSTSGFSFSTPASGFAAPQPTATATALPQTTQSSGFGASASFGQTSFSAKPTLNFGTTTTANTGVATPAFGSQTSQPSLSFGATSQQQSTGISFATPQQQQQPTATALATAFGNATGTPSTQATAGAQSAFAVTSQPSISFAATTTAAGTTFSQQQNTQPTVGISFGTTSAAATSASQPTLNFGSTPLSKATSVAGGIPFTPTTSQVPTGIAFGVPAATGTGIGQAGTLSFTATTAASIQPATSTFGGATAGISFAPVSTASQPAGFSFANKTATTTAVSGTTTAATSGITSFSFTKPAATTMSSFITPTTTTPAAPPPQIMSISFAELEENINKWTLDLEEQEKTFINQATQINAWDRLLIANGEKIVELNESVQTVKNEQQNLEHELDFVLAQQKELEDLLAPMEKQMMENSADRIRDPEREHMYTLAENLDTQMKQMSEDLKEVIEHLNETNMGQDSNDPIVQIGRILNTHMSSMQWIDNSITQISNKLDQLKVTHDKLRRDNERSFQLTYN